MGAPENQNHWIDSGFVVAENNPTVDRQKAEGRKKRQREKMLMVMNRKISLQVKKMKTMKTKLVIVEKPPGDYKTCAVSNLKVVAVVVVVHESPQNPATAGSTPSSPS